MNLQILRAFYAFLLPVILALAGAGAAGADETLTYQDLAHRLTDLERLSTLPADGEKGGMFSSYDRVDQYDAVHDRYIRWCDKCSADRGVIRKEGNVDVFAEMSGPGCIWRIWSAGAGNGHVKIYIDGSETPTIDLPFVQFFKNGPFTSWTNLSYFGLSPLVWEPGFNFYIPIPFQKSCKITGDRSIEGKAPGWGGFYQIEYTHYPAGTTLPTFQWPLSPEEATALDSANAALGKCGEDPAGARPGQQSETQAVTAAAGQWTTVAELTGPQAITGLKVKLDLPPDQEAQRVLLRQLTVRITWDDDKSPSVWSPLGDFFSFIGGGEPYETLATGLKDDGTFYSHWYMPFASRAKIEVGNDSGQPVPTTWEITRAPLDKPIGQLTRFHAKWHRDAFPPARKDRAPDWTILTTQGRGRFVGTMLHIWNPLGGWWGEGEARFFIDGEKFPSYFGTGSEDFFGYAWGAPSFFAHAYHAQPLNQGNYGHIDNIREQIPDNVPFQTSFEGCIEKFARNQGSIDPFIRYDLYAAEAYWYLAPGGIDPYGEIPVDQRIGYWTPPRETYNEPGVIEAEWMTVVPYDWNSGTPSIVGVWDVKQPNLKWSNDKELAWSASRPPGVDRLQLKFHVEKAGKYRVIAHLTKDTHDGIFQFGIDDQKLGQPVDLYNPTLIAADPVELGTADLQAGDHLFITTLAGRNAAITDRNKAMGFGIDYLKLVPAP